MIDQDSLPEAKHNAPAATPSPSVTIVLYKSDKFDRSATKVGGRAFEEIVKNAIDMFVADKIKQVNELQRLKQPITLGGLYIGDNDRGRMGKYYHYHLKVGGQTGKFVLFYEQFVDNVTGVVSFYLTLVVSHKAYLTKAATKQMMANMPTDYQAVKPVKESQTPVPVRQPLFSWLKKPSSS